MEEQKEIETENNKQTNKRKKSFSLDTALKSFKRG